MYLSCATPHSFSRTIISNQDTYISSIAKSEIKVLTRRTGVIVSVDTARTIDYTIIILKFVSRPSFILVIARYSVLDLLVGEPQALLSE